MSLAINANIVSAVLLADGWHGVEWLDADLSSFTLDAYEYLDGEKEVGQGNAFVLLGGGQEKHVPSTGFTFIEMIEFTKMRVSGPLTAVLAVRHKE